MKRGDIYYIDKPRQFGEQGNEMYSGRPGIIVSNDILNGEEFTFEVVYLTTQPKADRPEHVVIRSQARNSVACCEQITTVPVERIGTYYGTLDARDMDAVDRALAVSLGISSMRNEKPAPAPSEGVSEDANVTQIKTERDLYKKMYEDLLERVMR